MNVGTFDKLVLFSVPYIFQLFSVSRYLCVCVCVRLVVYRLQIV